MNDFFCLYKAEKTIGKEGHFSIERGTINGIRIIVRRAPLTTQNIKYAENNLLYCTLLKSSFTPDSCEIIKSNSEIFIVYSDIEGILLKDYILNKTIDDEVIGDLFLKLTSFLELLQSFDVIHSGLNPNCIMIDSVQNIKIISFDFCSQINDFVSISDYRSIEEVVYFAPEQIHVFNRYITYLTDIYGIGGVFYYILTGISPCAADRLIDLIYEILRNEIIAPYDIDTSVNQYYSAIVMKMLSKEPDCRYRDVKKLKNDIISAVIGGSEVPFHFQGGGFSKLLFTGKLYCRETEVKVLYTAFNRVQETNRSEMMIVNGDSGVGKTALIEEFREFAFIKKAFYIYGECDEYSGKLKPYGSIIGLIRKLYYEIINMDSDEKRIVINKIKHTIMGNGRILLDFVPEFEELIGQQPILSQLPPEENRNRLDFFIDSFFNIFSNDQYSLVVFIDDAQWIDNDSIHLLKIICGYSFNKKLFIIMSIRNLDFERRRQINSFIEEINTYKLGIIVNQMNLMPLNYQAVELIINDLLSFENQDVNKDLIQYIYNNTDGNPFYILQLLKYYQENGTIFKSGIVHDDFNLINGLNGLYKLFMLCYEKLSINARYVIDCAACFFCNYIKEDLLSKVSGIALVSVIKELSFSGLIFFDGHLKVYFFQSGFVRDYFHTRLTKESQSNIHKKIASFTMIKEMNDILIKIKHILFFKDQIEKVEMPLYANYLTTGAFLEMQVGEYDNAYLYYKTALQLYVKSEDFKNASIITIKIAILEYFKGNFQKVNDLLKIAIGYEESSPFDKDGIVLNIKILYDNKQYDKAILQAEKYLISSGVDVNIDYQEKSREINNFINSDANGFIRNLPETFEPDVLKNMEIMALMIFMASSENNADFNKFVILLSLYIIYSGITIFGCVGLLLYALILIDEGKIEDGKNIIERIIKFNKNIDNNIIKDFIIIMDRFLHSDKDKKSNGFDFCEIAFPTSIIDGFLLKYILQIRVLTYTMNLKNIEIFLNKNCLLFSNNENYTWLKDQVNCFSTLRDLINDGKQIKLSYSSSLVLLLYSLIHAYHFDDPVEAIQILDIYKNKKKNSIEDLLLKDEFDFYRAMIFSRLYSGATQFDKKYYLEEIDNLYNNLKNKKFIENNIVMIKIHILKHHLSKLHNDFKTASIILEEIIDLSRVNKLTYYEALGNSLAGDFYKTVGKDIFSNEYYEKSNYLYSLVGIWQKNIKKATTEGELLQQIHVGSILDYLQNFKVSNHEFRVIKFIEEGKSNKEIASLLFISESTVKKHISNIFKKLDIKNRYELINFYKQIGENGVVNTSKDVL